MKVVTKIKNIQRTLNNGPGGAGLDVDGIKGPKTDAAYAALDAATPPASGDKFEAFASSFADPADLRAFQACKDLGGSDNECFKYGDNGIGYYGASTKPGTGPAVALPPETIVEKWGSMSAGKHKLVVVQHRQDELGTTREVECILKDRMPARRNLANKATIDLNYDACLAFGLEPPIMEKVTWWWG